MPIHRHFGLSQAPLAWGKGLRWASICCYEKKEVWLPVESPRPHRQPVESPRPHGQAVKKVITFVMACTFDVSRNQISQMHLK